MAASMNVSIYIPKQALKDLSFTYLFGYYQRSDTSILINCTIGIGNNEMLKNVHEQLYIRTDIPPTDTFCFLGLLYSSKKKKNFQSFVIDYADFPNHFVLRVDKTYNSFHIENLHIEQQSQKIISHIILYDSCDLISSKLIFFNKANSLCSSQEKDFITFLYENFESNLKYSKELSSITENKCINFIESEENFVKRQFEKFLRIVLYLITLFSHCLSFALSIPLWLHQSILKIVILTRVGRQLHQRFLHCQQVVDEVQAKKLLSLKCKNLISAILIDVICGWIITFIFLHSNVQLLLLDYSIEQTNYLVSGLKSLIIWLMGAPAGLKLNIPLNSALGHFFLYHIYLWEAYMAVVLPLFTFILNISSIIGVVGATFILCVLSDLITLATVHIYCFYGYATRLYGYQMMSLAALWRLFRGRKWNPLRQRVDSFTYDIHQLFLGTLIFTVLLFLLPTVMVYYIVFTSLRIMVLTIQGILSTIINIITICPVYSVLSRIFSSSETTGDVHFTVFNTDATLVLSMEASQISLINVIQATVPELHKYEEYLTWKDFLSSILWVPSYLKEVRDGLSGIRRYSKVKQSKEIN
ncbi:hypothetical protein JTE90_017761 [Oedothorax gibbosus]|uniref:Phosphatidylinositol N-acetylglucosaminyltransferase subunit Q n=1 Tax=Oedothorax gibbosus TaxID=931172 RepID=A0AAV6UNS9_9ARAC|nr:hypothetical protein JTE90_017761 [Oedothorax gibbosus]